MTSSLIVSRNPDALLAYAKDVVAKYNTADVFWLRAQDDAKSIQVKETIEFIDKAHLSPVGDKKIFIVFDISTMTPQAQNKMLKTIEDAPAKTDFLLLATNPETVLNTIKSRCMTRYLPASIPPFLKGVLSESEAGVFNINFDEKSLSPEQRYAILNTLAEIETRKNANCNEKNAQDLIIMELLKICGKL